MFLMSLIFDEGVKSTRWRNAVFTDGAVKLDIHVNKNGQNWSSHPAEKPVHSGQRTLMCSLKC